ncbi:hypothetical protein FOC4_g10001163 [Fusarium odoratissimum]|uniref:Uncharacterized protein n=3 Tax=Fusarium oxysporum species complex TaxID=171631 RepID=N1S4M4_FUSC4|nr:uncharacterized protein FOIG_16374 [Fusarium odoratissimum NRRL 54006]EMT72531.1 hypothetical protein FOC4_g10001163 [Fusarium odoratissimum]EXL90374.1 hypothetical protein FOIG_16374 [Fusarium odoratissimum NRRL 54006]TXC08812.1 hypothetical protein FocTR4_00004149 [Fusarium oxysporum f. sp. cubense]
MAPDEAQPHKRKSGEANDERELDRAHDSRHLDRNRNRSVSDPDDDIPLKILKYTGESRPTLVQQDRRHSSTAMPAPSKVFPKLLSQPRPSQRSTSSGLKCAGCGSSSHRLNICMKASEHGLMTGSMQLEVIQMRASMPSFQPTQEWVDVVRAAVANGHSPPSSFPWTIQFAKTLHNSLSHYQRGLDRVGFNNRKGLPIDPDTKDWESVQRKFAPFEGY